MTRRRPQALRASAAGVALLLALLPGRLDAEDLACVQDEKPMAVFELVFGRRIGEGSTVSEARWAAFVSREIAPRFPDGFTVLDGRGQWRDPRRQAIVRERSKFVMVVVADDDDAAAKVSAIATAYKHAFHQQAVLVLRRRACAAF